MSKFFIGLLLLLGIGYIIFFQPIKKPEAPLVQQQEKLPAALAPSVSSPEKITIPLAPQVANPTITMQSAHRKYHQKNHRQPHHKPAYQKKNSPALMTEAEKINKAPATTTPLVSSSALEPIQFSYGGGFYLQGSLGVSKVYAPAAPSDPAGDTATLTDLGFAWGAGLGYLWKTGFWYYGLEADYNNTSPTYYNSTDTAAGNANVTILLLRSYDISLLAVGRYDFAQHWNVLAKVGPAMVQQTVSGAFITDRLTKISVFPKVALGLGYQYDQHWGANLTVDYLFGKQGAFYNDFVFAQTDLPTLSSEKIMPVGSVLFNLSYTF